MKGLLHIIRTVFKRQFPAEGHCGLKLKAPPVFGTTGAAKLTVLSKFLYVPEVASFMVGYKRAIHTKIDPQG